jgi:DNA-binding beta-propeller fold protein YncE
MRFVVFVLIGLAGCGNQRSATATDAGSPDAALDAAHTDGGVAALPLLLVADVDLPGSATRFDYQEVDAAKGQLVVTHMNANAVLILDLATGAVRKQLTNIPTPRGVAVADDVGLIFVTSTPSRLVLIDNQTLNEVSRVPTGTAPDGDGWDPVDKIVGVSDQGDGAISLIANAGSGTRTQVPLGVETGNVVYDAARGRFWITVVRASPPDQLVAVDPVAAKVTTTIGLPGCDGAHGLRLHPDGQSAFVACEGNDMLARVDLGGAHALSLAATGSGPDVLAIDAALGWLYVAAESGDLTVFDLRQPGVVLVGHDQPGDNSHSVAVDPATHRVFFPLMQGPNGTPVLRVMKPSGS